MRGKCGGRLPRQNPGWLDAHKKSAMDASSTARLTRMVAYCSNVEFARLMPTASQRQMCQKTKGTLTSVEALQDRHKHTSVPQSPCRHWSNHVSIVCAPIVEPVVRQREKN